VVEHVCQCIVERRRRAAQEGACEGAALQLVAAGLGLGRAPVPGIAAHVIDAVGADAACVAVNGGCAALAALAAVDLRGGPLVAPGVDLASGSSGCLLPLLGGGESLGGPLGVCVGVMPSDEHDRVVFESLGDFAVLPVLRWLVVGRCDEPSVVGV